MTITTAIRDERSGVAFHGRLTVGAPVEVRNRFDRRWARGFEVAVVTDTGVRVRRLSDGRELPDEFAIDEVRAHLDHLRGTWSH